MQIDCLQHELCKKVAEVVNSPREHKSTAWGFENVVFQMPLLPKAPLRYRQAYSHLDVSLFKIYHCCSYISFSDFLQKLGKDFL